MDNGASSYRRFLAGDSGGLVEIVAQYADGLILFLRPIVGDLHTAEDIAEETFAKLIVKKPKYTDQGSFKTWLFTIGRNLALDYVRKNTREILSDKEPPAVLISEQESLESAYIRNEEKATLLRAINALKPEYAEVLRLTYFEELSNRQTAKIMHKSVHAIENLNSRARAALKEYLFKEGIFDENL